MRLVVRGIIALFIGVLLFGLVSPKVFAAGSAVYTVESSATVTTGQNLELRFYVTPSGQPLFSATVNVTLTNLSYVSFDATGTSFSPGQATVPAGNSAGSTAFTLYTSFQAPSTGASGKLYMGKVTVQAGSAGSGQINLTASDTYENVSDPGEISEMSASAQDRSVTVQATSSGGGGGSSSGGSGGTGSSPNSSNNSNPTTNPNSQSNVAVPGSETDSDTPSEIISEDELAASFAAQNSSGDTTEQTTVTAKKSLPIAFVVVPLAALLIIGAGVFVFLRWRAAHALSGHAAASFAPPTDVDPAGQPIPDVQQNQPLPHDDGPTIIKPQS